MQSSALTVDAYLAELPDGPRAELLALRQIIRECVPGAVEVMRYGMPGFEIGESVCGFARQKRNLALYICDTDLLARYKPLLGKLDMGKCCIRFRSLDRLPMDVIARLITEAAARHAAGVPRITCGKAR